MQIFHAFGAVVGRLGGGITDALEDGSQRDCRRRREPFGEERGLVEAALAFPRRMKRDRNDEVEVSAAQPQIVETFAKPSRDRMAEMALLPVFELMQNVANEAPAAIGGHRAIEMESAMFAIGAAKGLGDGAGKRLGTFRAERRHDTRRTFAAIATEILGALDVRGANDARRRIEERGRGLNDPGRGERMHSSTTF